MYMCICWRGIHNISGWRKAANDEMYVYIIHMYVTYSEISFGLVPKKSMGTQITVFLIS